MQLLYQQNTMFHTGEYALTSPPGGYAVRYRMFPQFIHRISTYGTVCVHSLSTEFPSYPHAPRTHGEPLGDAHAPGYGTGRGSALESLTGLLRRLAHSLQVGYFAQQHGPYLARHELLQSNNPLRGLVWFVLRAPERARFVYCAGRKRCCIATWHSICMLLRNPCTGWHAICYL